MLQLSPSAHKNIAVCGTTFALRASPIDPPDCLPRDCEYHNPLISAPLHSFGLIPANITEGTAATKTAIVPERKERSWNVS